ncbi:MAG TPA: nucleotidyltransferase family protein [Pyrinomonadaceae bacterium]|nr:nucleotidyltransferase family protein [Pyrinomonadaceae bacterium]HMP65902.1 nucleotidyltransferase family protein [Pyrinomonadaceae bacterium]
MQVQNKTEIFDRLRGVQHELGVLGVRRLGIFGSFVRNEQDRESDVDVLIEFDPSKKTFENFMNTAFLLEDTLGRKVDLVTRESLSPHLGPRILEEVEYGVID